MPRRPPIIFTVPIVDGGLLVLPLSCAPFQGVLEARSDVALLLGGAASWSIDICEGSFLPAVSSAGRPLVVPDRFGRLDYNYYLGAWVAHCR